MTIYRLRNARVRFGDGTVVALPDLDVERGERIGIVAPNGAGKTTLLRVLAFLAPAEGEVRAEAVPSDVAFVAQRPYLFRGTVSANVALGLSARRVARAERHERVADALRRLGAAHTADRLRSQLSAGEAHRAALARALVASPQVLLLDEPLGPLDADGASRLAGALHEMAGATVVAAAPATDGLPFRDGCRLIRLSG